MAVVTYSTKDDLRYGDLRLPARLGDGTSFVESAAEDIEAQLGHIYVTPFAIPDVPANRPSILLLKKINNLVASGRLVLDLAASSEDDQLHAYGRAMLKEGLELLGMVRDRNILLTGAELITDSDGDKTVTGPVILNEDKASLVEGFYAPPTQVLGAEPFPAGWPAPYSNNRGA